MTNPSPTFVFFNHICQGAFIPDWWNQWKVMHQLALESKCSIQQWLKLCIEYECFLNGNISILHSINYNLYTVCGLNLCKIFLKTYFLSLGVFPVAVFLQKSKEVVHLAIVCQNMIYWNKRSMQPEKRETKDSTLFDKSLMFHLELDKHSQLMLLISLGLLFLFIKLNAEKLICVL